MTRDIDKQMVYDAERFAFEGTPLADSLHERDITSAYEDVSNSALWPGKRFEVRQARVDMTRAGGFAHGADKISTSASRVPRYVVSHECAHLLHNASPTAYREEGHGYEYRLQHVRAVSLIFGVQYGVLLAKAYRSFGLDADGSQIDPAIQEPIIDIDALSIVTAPVGGWRRPA